LPATAVCGAAGCAKHALVVVARVAALQFLEQRHRVEFAVDRQQRNDLHLPDIGERVVAGAPTA